MDVMDGNLSEFMSLNADAQVYTNENTAEPNAGAAHLITVTMEDLQEAGINVGNMSELTEDQVQALVAISQRRQQQQQPTHQPSTSQGRTAAAPLGTPHGGNMPPVLEPMPLTSVPAGSELNGYHTAAGQENYDRVEETQQRPPQQQQQLMLDVESEDSRESQITITITDEGHVKLTDAAQQTFFFSRDELAQRNIDASDLTDANIQQLIQMAMPSLDVGNAEGAAPRKRQRVESTASTSAAPAPADHYYSRPMAQVNQQQPSTSGVQQYAPNAVTSLPAASQAVAAAPEPPRAVRLLTGHIPGAAAGENNAVVVRNGPAPMSLQFGDEVDVRKDGRIQPAVIRYSRPTIHGTGFKVQFHDGRFEWVNESQIVRRSQRTNNLATYAGRPRSQPQLNGHSRARTTSLRLSTSSENATGAAAAMPGIRVTPAQPQHSSHAGPNFHCAVCDRKVHQRQATYIVIRLPACHTCAEENVLLVDGEDEPTTSDVHDRAKVERRESHRSQKSDEETRRNDDAELHADLLEEEHEPPEAAAGSAAHDFAPQAGETEADVQGEETTEPEAHYEGPDAPLEHVADAAYRSPHSDVSPLGLSPELSDMPILQKPISERKASTGSADGNEFNLDVDALTENTVRPARNVHSQRSGRR